MEDNRKTRECKLKRCYECTRLQDELWNMAYEQVWPLVRRSLARRQSQQKQAWQEQLTAVGKGA